MDRNTRLIIAMGGFAILFAVLCPFTATPTAVVKSQQHLLPILAAFVIVFTAPLPQRVVLAFMAPVAILRTGQDVIELTCTRLC